MGLTEFLMLFSMVELWDLLISLIVTWPPLIALCVVMSVFKKAWHSVLNAPAHAPSE